jgi:fluoroquinolone resistance protein
MITENETFSKVDFKAKELDKEYEDCVFDLCDFSDANLTDVTFIECTFKDCDLSNAKLSNTSFKDVTFLQCKMLGLHFDDCNKFLLEMRFENCSLNLSSFYQLKLKGIRFKDCQLHEVDFASADLTNAQFHNCDLAKTTFDNTILEKADFRTATNYTLDPEVNYIKKARFSNESVVGLLAKYDIEIS